MPDNQPQVVINNVPASAPASSDAVKAADPTVRYLVEQARSVAAAGASATPEMLEKIESEVKGYGEGCFLVAGAYTGLTSALLLGLVLAYKKLSGEASGILGALFLCGAAASGIATMCWLQEGALAYFAPLIWVGKQIGGAL